jgi:hypothetical protein
MGEPGCPPILTAAVSKRPVHLRHPPTTTLVMGVRDRQGGEDVGRVHTTLRQTYPFASDLLLVTVVDLSRVPRLLHSFVRMRFRRSFRRSASMLPSTIDPADYIVSVQDWTGAIVRALSLDDGDQLVGALALPGVDGALRLRAPDAEGFAIQVVAALQSRG